MTQLDLALPGAQAAVAALELMTDEELDAFVDAFGTQFNPPTLMAMERLVGSMGRGWRADPLRFAMHLDIRVPEKIIPFRHMQLLARQFVKAIRGVNLEDRFQLWSLPSQMQKTTSLVLGSAWALDQDPTLPIIYTGYSNDLSRRAAMLVRDIARAHADQLQFTLKQDEQRADAWRTDAGGGMLGHGLHGALAGFPARLVLVDDPLENFQKAHSKPERDAADNEIRAVARLRLAEGGAMIMAHARWHIDDPTGRLVKMFESEGIPYTHVILPMIQPDEPDPWLGRQPGEVIEERRYSINEARSRRAFLANYRTAAMEQQRPLPEEGGEFKREWWQLFPSGSAPTSWDAATFSWDTKLKDKATGDYTVGQLWVRTGAHVWMLDSVRGKWTLRQAKIMLAALCGRWPAVTKHVVEAAGYAAELKDELSTRDDTFVLRSEECDELGIAGHERAEIERRIRQGIGGIITRGVTENKIIRARVHLSPPLEALQVHVPDDPRGYDLQDEAAGFPPSASKGGHDDQVDAASQALRELLHTSYDAIIMGQATESVKPADASSRVMPKGGGGGGVQATILG